MQLKLMFEEDKRLHSLMQKHGLGDNSFVVSCRRFIALKQYSDELNTVISQLLRVRAVSFCICKQ